MIEKYYEKNITGIGKMKRKAITRICIILTAIPLLLAGCTPKGQIMDGDGMLNTYRQISQEEAKKMMTADDGHIIVDVRRQDEYEAGHIPGAILIPNEAIGTERPEELPDTEQVILIYCRSGRRSKEAAQKLFDMGYRKIYEFGGIIDWTGDIVTGSDPDGDSGSTEDRQGDKESSGGVSGSEQTEPEETDYGLVEPSATLVMEANGRIFYPEPEDNSSAESFLEKLNKGSCRSSFTITVISRRSVLFRGNLSEMTNQSRRSPVI